MTRGSIDRRIEALEALYSGEPCEECGDDGSSTWEVVWVDPDGPSEPKWCGTCGRQTEFIVTWGDLSDPPRP